MNVLDSSALLALILREEGGEKIRKLSEACFRNKESVFIHQINYIEVVCRLSRDYSEKEVGDILGEFLGPWWGNVNYLDTDLALSAAHLKNKYKNISLGDVIGLSYTKIMTGVFWTADKFLKEVGDDEGIEVKLIR